MGRWQLLLLAGAVLGGCATQPSQEEAAQRATYAAAAGEPVARFHYFTLYSWEPLGEQELVVYDTPRRAWLLDLDGPCPGLLFSASIGLSSNNGEVWARFDKVLPGQGTVPCTIKQIRPLDVSRLKAAQARPRPIHDVSRPAAGARQPSG